MEREFVTFELAVKLRELRFDEPCLAAYSKEREFVVKLQSGNKAFEYFDNNKFCFLGDSFSAPLWQQAFDWFREKHNLMFDPVPVFDKWNDSDKICGWGFQIYNTENGDIKFQSADYLGQVYKEFDKRKYDGIEKLIELTNTHKNGK